MPTRLPGRTAYRSSSTRWRAWGATTSRTAWDVLVGDARSWGGPPLGVLVVREGVRWQWSGARADVEHGRTDVGPWVPLALAAAEAWQQAHATCGG